MEDAIKDPSTLPFDEQRRLPWPDWFTPDAVKRDRELDQLARTATDNNFLVLSDTDADGLACAAVAKEGIDNPVGYIPGGPHDATLDLTTALEATAEQSDPDATVFICDISPNPDDWDAIAPAVEQLGNSVMELIWCDHHEYDPAIETELDGYVTELRIGDSDEQCAADVLYEYLSDTIDVSFDAHITELVEVTRDRDCWILDDPRNQDIADYAEYADYDTYIATVREHGPDLPDDVMEDLEGYRSEKERLLTAAVNDSDFYALDVEENDAYDADTLGVAMTYGRCPSSDTAEEIRNRYSADIVVMVKPSGTVSFRGSERFEECNEIAERFGGGGHGKAAGCKPSEKLFDSVLDYAEHWQTDGTRIRQAVMMAFTSHLDCEVTGI